LDPLIRSVSRVTAARANASSVFQSFSFLVVCSDMISKGFGFVAFFLQVSSEIISQTEKAFFQLFSSPVICSVIISAVPIQGTLITPIFHHSDTTKAQQLESRLK